MQAKTTIFFNRTVSWPVWGTLINFTGMKRFNARGLKAANKMLVLAAMVYNLKKWLRFTAPQTTIKTMALLKTKMGKGFVFIKNLLQQHILTLMKAMQIFRSPACF